MSEQLPREFIKLANIRFSFTDIGSYSAFHHSEGKDEDRKVSSWTIEFTLLTGATTKADFKDKGEFLDLVKRLDDHFKLVDINPNGNTYY